MIGDIILVSDQNDGISGPVELFKKDHNLIPSLRVQISGRFISQEDGWIIDQCPRYRYSLSLPSRHITRVVMHPVPQADPGQGLFSPLFSLLFFYTCINKR